MHKSMFGVVLCLSVIASISASQVNAQYTGRIADSPVAKSTVSVGTPVVIKNVGIEKAKKSSSTEYRPGAKIAGTRALASVKGAISKGGKVSGTTELSKVFNANSANFKVFLFDGRTKSVPFSTPSKSRAVTQAEYLRALPPPTGAKKGHWMPAAPASMTGAPTWVEDKQ